MIGLLTAISELDYDAKTFLLDLYKNYYFLTKKTIFNITHENQDIEDLINDSFIKLIEKVALLRTLDRPRTTSYIYYTAKSVAINYIKHQQVENTYMYYSDEAEMLKDDVADNESNLEVKLIHQEEAAMLSEAISKLPKKEKDILYFKYILEMKDSEIANTFGIAISSVREYLTRARRDAKKLMNKEMSNNA